ncbi:MAG: metallopeptidase TldD-related protein [Candidatus Njordarchaeia archaeon]
MKDLIQELIDYGKSLGAQYIEVRIDDRFINLFRVVNRDVESSSIGQEKGVSIRVVSSGAWGFSSIDHLDKDKLKKAVKEAVDMANGTSNLSKFPVRLADVDAVEDRVKSRIDVDPRNVSPEEKIEALLDLSARIFGRDRRVNGTEIDYADIHDVRYFGNSDGTYIEQEKIYVWSRILATAKENGVITSARYEVGSTTGYNIWKTDPIDEIAKTMGERLINQLKAKPPKGGEWPAVLGPEVVGVFTHEAFGHLGEADLTFMGAVTMQKIGQKIASEIVNISDDGRIEGGFGSFLYDDEGVPTQKTVLVKDGVLVGLMYNREYAARFEDMLKANSPQVLEYFNVKPTGNARAENFRFEPIIRMRNTYIEPGEYNLEELFEDIKFGYYFKAFRGGQANLDGTFQVGIQEAYEIVNGEIGEPVQNVSISGNTLKTLELVEAVGKDFKLHPGRCGKGQTAYVGDGGPHIRVKKITVGGEA